MTRGHMKKAKFGKLPPRFTFILNPHAHIRVSKCPICRRLTHMRKFPLLIYIDKWGFLALGKTCRYCSLCELIVVHQDELEDELVHTFERVAPDVIGNQYLVLGTVEKKLVERRFGSGQRPTRRGFGVLGRVQKGAGPRSWWMATTKLARIAIPPGTQPFLPAMDWGRQRRVAVSARELFSTSRMSAA